jgi:hypothetical protein
MTEATKAPYLIRVHRPPLRTKAKKLLMSCLPYRVADLVARTGGTQFALATTFDYQHC